MGNSFTALLPTLLAERALNHLKHRSIFLEKIYIESISESYLKKFENNAVPIYNTQKDVIEFTNYNSFDITAEAIENRIGQGNFEKIMESLVDDKLDNLVCQFDKSIASLYSHANFCFNSKGCPLTHEILKKGVLSITKTTSSPQINLVVAPEDFYSGILTKERYVLAATTFNSINRWIIPSLENIGVDYSPNIIIEDDTIHNILFEKHALVAMFLEFDLAKTYSANAPVDEAIITDPDTSVSIRVQKWYNAPLHTWIYTIDCKWGAIAINKDKLVHIIT